MNEKEYSSEDKLPGRVAAVLDEGARTLSADTLSRLYDSRRKAMSALHTQHVGDGTLALTRHPALWGMAIVAALLASFWFATQQTAPQRLPVLDNSELDIQLLSGELPPQVIADWSLVTQENVEAVCLTES